MGYPPLHSPPLPSLPLPFSPFPSPPCIPSLSVEVATSFQLEGMGSSRVWGRATSRNHFVTFQS